MNVFNEKEIASIPFDPEWKECFAKFSVHYEKEFI